MTVLSLFPSFPPLLQSLQLTQCLLVLSLCLFQHSPSFFFPFLFSFCFFLCFFYLPIRSSALPISSTGDDCPRHLCSVSQMSHNRTWNTNLAVDMAEKWWWGGRCFCPVVPKGECWTLAPCVLTTANQKQKRPEWVNFNNVLLPLLCSNTTFQCTSCKWRWFWH